MYQDIGQGLTNDRLRWGNTYVYRMRGHSSEGKTGVWSEEYTFTLPAFLPPDNVRVDTSSSTPTLRWDALSIDDAAEEGSIRYFVYESTDGSSYSNFGQCQNIEATSCTLSAGDSNLSYKVRAHHPAWGHTALSASSSESSNGGPGGSGSGPSGSVAYSFAALSSFSLSDGTSSIYDWGLQSVLGNTGTQYIAIADNATKSPVVYKYAGVDWDNLSFPTDVTSQSGPYGWMRLAAALDGAEEVYFALRDGSRIYLYGYGGGSWDTGTNLARSDGIDNFGLGSEAGARPSDLDIAIFDGDLYAATAAYGGGSLTVRKLDTTPTPITWDAVGSEFLGDISLPGLTVHDGELYLHWVDRSGDATFRVRKLNAGGAAWDIVLDWSGTIADLRPQLAWVDGELQFMVSSGVFRRTGSSTAESLAWNYGELFSMTADASGNIFVASRNTQDPANQFPIVSRFTGTEWQRITGPDFTTGTWPVNLTVVGGGINYSFTDRSNDSNLKTYRLTP